MVDWTLVQKHKNALMEDARTARELSYSPYSKYRVGAAFLLSDGTRVKGANVENASYGCAICAERTAIAKIQTTPEWRVQTIHAVAVTSDSGLPCTPCGICRQVLREFCAQDTVMFMPSKEWAPSEECKAVTSLKDLAEDHVLLMDMDMLLPHSFGPEALAV